MQLSVPQDDGASLRAHLVAARRAGEFDARMAEVAVPLPKSIELLWRTFEILSGTRAADGAITFAEMEAWQRLHGVKLTPWEVETISAMDRAALAAGAEASRKASRK